MIKMNLFYNTIFSNIETLTNVFASVVTVLFDTAWMLLRRWMSSGWGKCSVTCGEGRQFRNIRCWQTLESGFHSSVHSALCATLVPPSPVRNCRQIDCGPLWEMSEWSQVNLERAMQRQIKSNNEPVLVCRGITEYTIIVLVDFEGNVK